MDYESSTINSHSGKRTYTVKEISDILGIGRTAAYNESLLMLIIEKKPQSTTDPLRIIVLRASKEETMKRAIKRSKLDRETNIELVETMWEQFSNLGIYESNVIDTTTHSVKDTVSAVKEKIVRGTALLL